MPLRRPTHAPARPSSTALHSSSRGFLWAVGLLFFLSGAAGLIYESIWSRYLGLLVGHSAYAQVIVLVIFMGGMAAGALGIGRISERLRRPLLAYALVEGVIGLMGLAFHPVYVAATDMATTRWMPQTGGPPGTVLIQWGLSALLILPQSVLLGTTFPLMSAAVVRRIPQAPGRALGLLYFSNSLGAAVGVLASGLWLVGLAGLPGTVGAAAILNLVVAAAAVALQRGSTDPTLATPATERTARAAPERLLLAVAFGTALASFIYEIAWVRMLSLVLGSATHSFELMLSAFILGLALGAWWVRSRADRFARPVLALGATQWAMGVLALATLPLYMASFHWIASLVQNLPPTAAGYRLFTLGRYGVCLAVMLPATFCAGITLPLITRILIRAGAGERAIGLVYGLNTLGSIAGAILAGLVLMPWLGLKGLLTAGATLDIALGLALLAIHDRGRTAGARRLFPAGAVAAFLLVVAMVGAVRLDRLTLVSGVYREGALLRPEESRVEFYRDGRTATVSVRRQPAGDLTLSTNGKPDASLHPALFQPVPGRPLIDLTSDESTQLLLGLVSLAHRPDAATVAVVGQGSGVTSHVLLGSPAVKRLVTIEIEPEVIEASRRFDPVNRRVFQDPRSVFAIEDARSYMASTGERFDLIVSEPSNPWVSGVAGLFTEEFYRRMSRSLTTDGVLAQWLHLYSLDDPLVLGVLAAIQRSFRDYEIYLVSSADVLIIATNSPRGLHPDWSVLDLPAIREELRGVVPFTPSILEATRVTDRQVLAPLVERAAVNSDYFPHLDLGAERARFTRRMADGLVALHYDRAGMAYERARPVGPLPSGDVPIPQVLRVRGLSWGALVRETLAGAPPRPEHTAEMRSRLAASAERIRRVLAPAETGAPPSDWRTWVLEALQAEDDLHLGTSRYADPQFFAALRRIAAHPAAPADVARIVEWMRAIEARDDSALASRMDEVVEIADRDGAWLPAEVVVGPVVRLRLARGNVDGAREAYARLRPRLRQPDDLRVRLMAAHLDAASRP